MAWATAGDTGVPLRSSVIGSPGTIRSTMKATVAVPRMTTMPQSTFVAA